MAIPVKKPTITKPVITKPAITPKPITQPGFTTTAAKPAPKPAAPKPLPPLTLAPSAGYNGVKSLNNYRIEVNGKIVDTADKRLIDRYVNQQGGKIISTPGQKAGFDEAAYLKEQQDGVNSVWDKTREAQLAQLEASRQRAIGNINSQKGQVAPQYQGLRNQADVVSNQNAQRLRENMAASGLQSSGENVTANIGLSNARQGALNNLNTQEQGIMNDFERQIMQLNDPAEQNALMAQLEAQRSQALMDAGNRAEDRGYQIGKDSKEDAWRQGQFDYQKGRDAIEDKYRNDQFAFEKARFKSEDDWRKYTYKNLSAAEKNNFDIMQNQFGEDMAWRMYELNYNGNLQQSMNQAQIDFYGIPS